MERVDQLRAGDPRKIGSFRLLGRLGEGGMGQVFLGASPGGRKVAIKVVHSQHANDPEFRRRFTREVEAARQVGGFHTALVVEADPDADPPWMATSYVPGPSLAEAVSRHGPLREARLRELGAALAEGLEAIHACGLIHRDLKPGNIILADDGPRIIDFGIVRDADATSLTSSNAIIGTIRYMSPEQLHGQDLTPLSDVFALGATLVYAATGHDPFQAPTIPAVIYRIVNDPPDLDQLAGGLRDIIEACLAKQPAGRPAPGEILARFNSLAAPRDSTADAVPVPVPVPAPAPPAAPARARTPAPAARAARRRRPGRTAVAGTAAAAAVAVAVVLAVLLDQHPARTLSASGSTATPPTASASSAASPVSSSQPISPVTVTGAFGTAPKVTIPARRAPSSLYIRTLVAGSGARLTSTEGMFGNYVAYDWSGTSHKLLGSSYGEMPSLFAGRLLTGLKKALYGQSLGSRVLAVIPPADGFGSAGNPTAGVKATDTLVFVIDMTSAFVATDVLGPQTSDGGGALPTVTPPAANSTAGPAVMIPAGTAPPQTLQVKTLIRGTGTVVKKGDEIAVQYTGLIWRTRQVFQSTWSQNSPAALTVGVGNDIKGMDSGLVGQTVGSRVLIVIPPADGYGSAGVSSAGIRGTDTLVFAVDILGAA